MSGRRQAPRGTPHFTIEQLRGERSRVLVAAKEPGGVIVVDEQGERRFSLSIPHGPLD